MLIEGKFIIKEAIQKVWDTVLQPGILEPAAARSAEIVKKFEDRKTKTLAFTDNP